jgi:tetratricopeptide (TPR) repeat protein
MFGENLKYLFKLYSHPHAAASEIMDRGSWLFAAGAVVLVSVLWQFGVASPIYRSYQSVIPAHSAARPDPNEPAEEDGIESELPERRPLPVVGNLGWVFVSFSFGSVMASVLTLAVLYVPVTLLIINLLEDLGSFSVILQRDYGALLTCTLMNWAAAHLPLSLAGLVMGAWKPAFPFPLALWLAGKIFFGALMIPTLRTVFGAGYGSSIIAVCVSWVSMGLQSYLAWLASPFLLFWGYYFLRGDVGDILWGFRSRQSFKRQLEATTLNPHDADAQIQLGLLHLQRHQYMEAADRFKKALEIDPEELDAHFQLGRLARMQARPEEALEHFNHVVARDKQFAQNDIWRELGATHLAAGRAAEARQTLEYFVERRPYDPEGLYWLGETLLKLGERPAARDAFERCIEAEKTNPYSRHQRLRNWRRLAEKQLRSLRD